MRNSQSLPGIVMAARVFLLIALAGIAAALVLILGRTVEYDGAATILLTASTALIVVAMLLLDAED